MTQNIRLLLQQNQDALAIQEIQKQRAKQNPKIAELMFALGDWSKKWLRIRTSLQSQTDQSRLRCDLAQRFIFNEGPQPSLEPCFPEEQRWISFIKDPKSYLPNPLLPKPTLGWSTPFREQITQPFDTIDIHRWARVLSILQIPMSPWLKRLWKSYRPTPHFLTAIALLGLSYPAAIADSIRATLCAAECIPHPLWNILYTRYLIELRSSPKASQSILQTTPADSKLLSLLKQDSLRRLNKNIRWSYHRINRID